MVDALSLLANIVMAWNTAQMQAVLDRWANHRQIVPQELTGVVLFARIGALCSEKPFHDKHLRFRHFRALRNFRANWCASAPTAL